LIDWLIDCYFFVSFHHHFNFRCWLMLLSLQLLWKNRRPFKISSNLVFLGVVKIFVWKKFNNVNDLGSRKKIMIKLFPIDIFFQFFSFFFFSWKFRGRIHLAQISLLFSSLLFSSLLFSPRLSSFFFLLSSSLKERSPVDAGKRRKGRFRLIVWAGEFRTVQRKINSSLPPLFFFFAPRPIGRGC